jgi:hypothetical protein
LIASNFDSVWKELGESGTSGPKNGVVLRRISADSPHDFYLGFDNPTSRRMLLVRVSKKEAFPFEQLPEFRGFEISVLKFPDEKPDKIMLSLSLNDASSSEIFSALCEDLFLISSKEPDEKKMVQYLRERLLQWKQFLELNGNQGLSPEAQRGLYGELRFLRDVLFAHMDISKAIVCWQGPSRKNQDFQISGTGIEVKTSVAKQHQKIQVANELQLDDNDLDSLFLYFLSLKETYEHGETLPGIIDNIRKIIDINNGSVTEFETRLFSAGYLDKHRTRYSKTGYHNREIQIFQVDENFPRIIETDLKPGVGDVCYSIDLAVCRRFRVCEEDFISDLEWIKNGR